jgi:radical SAM-linked protein
MQRLRLKFGRGEGVKFISHLDVMHFWERVFRRGEIPLAYSQGFTPHPRISVAAPLAVGVTSGAELVDVWLNRWMPPQSFMMRVRSQLPQGFDVFEVWEVGLTVPSLQSCLALAEYHVGVMSQKSEQDVAASICSLLQAKELPWHHSRGDKVHSYDLRALIDDLWVVSCHDALCLLGMRLHCNANGSGRPEQVLLALGFSQLPESIHRTKLILKGMVP